MVRGIYTDRFNIKFVAVAMLLLFSLGFVAQSAYATTTTIDSYITGDDGHISCLSTYWVGQSITYNDDYYATVISVKCYRIGSPGTVTLNLYAVDGAGKPTGSSLASATRDGNAFTTDTAGSYYAFTLSVAVKMTENVQYVFVVKTATSGGNTVEIKFDSTSPTYAGGLHMASTDSGSTWATSSAFDMMFIITGSISPDAINGDLSDPDTTNNIYAMRKYYTFLITVDAGTNDIHEIVVYGINSSAVTVWTITAHALETSPTYTISSGSTIIDIDSDNCDWDSGTGVLTLKVRAEWDYVADSGSCVVILVTDTIGGIDTSAAMDNFDIITSLIATMDTTTTDVYLGQPVYISGHVNYPTAPGGSTNSTFYPPDAEFTGVYVTEGASYVTVDNNIVNGYYNVAFTSPLILQLYTYTLYLDMTPDFVDGEPFNTPHLDITVTGGVDDLIDMLVGFVDSVFSFFGIAGGGTSIVDLITEAASYFTDSVSLMITTITTFTASVFNFSVFLFDWSTRVLNTVTSLTDSVLGILDGTASVTTGLGNIWTTFGGSNLVDFMPVAIVVGWLSSVDSRKIKRGLSIPEIVIGDMQTLFGLFNILYFFINLVYSTVVDWVRWVFSYRPV